jgi:hypothetical protein
MSARAVKPRQVIEIEIATMVGAAVIGAVFLLAGGTAGRVAPYLLGWAGGCAAHLTTLALRRMTGRRRGPR